MHVAMDKTVGQPALSDQEFRSLYNLLYRLTGSRGRAKVLLAQAVAPGTPDDATAWRERLVALLGPEESHLCLLRRAQELLTSIPPLPRSLPDPERQPTAFEHAVKDVLPPAYLALIELAFVEGRSPAQLGQLLGVGEPLVLGFLAGFLEELSDVSEEDHGATCAGAWTAFAHVARGTSPESKIACFACDRGLERARMVRKALSHDTRIVSFSDQAFIKKALAAPPPPPPPDLSHRPSRRPAQTPQGTVGATGDAGPESTERAEGSSRRSGPVAASSAALRPEERRALMRAFAPVLVIPLLIGGLWLHGRHEQTGDDGMLGTFSTGLATISGTVLGTVSDGVGPARALVPHTTLQAAADRTLTLSFHSGLDAILWPGSRCMVATGDFELISGKARLMTPVGAQVGERIQVAGLSGLMQEGDMLVMNDGDSPTRFHVRVGRIRVHGTSDQHWNLGSGDLLSSVAGGAGYQLGAQPATDLAFRPPSPDASGGDSEQSQ